ncbi:hypothetical protein TWF694_005434 [Orbilia ellipsospora]|uniref:F-box domain-containing protein n=1 Tax=Orbilia ellipsospora TaxID=2528407 RepID=A0AAV9WV81_9PEZI
MATPPVTISPLDVPELLDSILCCVADPPTGLGNTSAPLQGLIDVWCTCRLVNKYWKTWIETSPAISKLLFRCKAPTPRTSKNTKVNLVGLAYAAKLFTTHSADITFEPTRSFSKMFSHTYITYPPVKWARVIWQKKLQPYIDFLIHPQTFGQRRTRFTFCDGNKSKVKGFEDCYIMWIQQEEGIDVDGFVQCMLWIYRGTIEYCLRGVLRYPGRSPLTPPIREFKDDIEVEFLQEDRCIVATRRIPFPDED